MPNPPPTELFDGSACDRRYPVADYVQTFEFAQFLDLVVEPPPREEHLLARKAAPPLPLLVVEGEGALEHVAQLAGATGSSIAAGLGGMPLSLVSAGEEGFAMATRPVLSDVVELDEADVAGTDDRLMDVIRNRTGVDIAVTRLADLRAGGLSLSRFDGNALRMIRVRPNALPDPDPDPEPDTVTQKPQGGPMVMRSRMSMQERSPDEMLAAEKPGLALAAVVPWVQRWKLLGYSRGKLIQSLTLAPQEETTIEVFSWDRTRRTLDQTSQTDIETASETDMKRQDSLDTLNELLTSNEMNREVGAQFSASYGTSDRTYVKLDANGKLTAKDSVNRTARQTGKRLSDLTAKASSRVKTQRTSKITEASEFGRENRVTRKIRNANMCRTLSFDYFELMVTYEVETEPDPGGVVLCLMVTNPFAQATNPLHIGVFKDEDLRVYDSILRPALMNPELATGFDAARMLAARAAAKSIACETYGCGKASDPVDTDGDPGGLDTYRPPSFTSLPSWQAVVDTGTTLANIAASLFDASPQSFFDCYPASGGGGASQEAINAVQRYVYARLLYRIMTNFAGALDSLKAWGANPPTDPDQLREALKRVALAAPAGAGAGSAEALTPVSTAPWSMVEPIVNAVMASVPENRRAFMRGKLDWWGAWAPNDAGLPPALDRFTGAWARFEQAVAAAATPPAQTTTEEKAAAQQDAQSTEDRMTYDFPTREVAEAIERVEALKIHLNLFADYYRYVLLRGLPPAEMLSRLATGLPPDQRDQLLQPRILAWRGSQVAVPVDPNSDSALADILASVAEGLEDVPPVEPFYTSMPTPGMAMETRLGHCSGCEPFIETSREIELDSRRRALDAETLEVERAKARLSASPPDLSPPTPVPPAGLTVVIDKPAP